METILENGSTSVVQISYNAEGRRKDLTGGVTTTYGYDGIVRLSSLSHDLAGTAEDVTYSFSAYNPANQLLAQSRDNDNYGFPEVPIVTTSYAVNGLNQYTAVGPDTMTHDANGNLKIHGATEYAYDVENRLLSATESGTTIAALDYDPMGRLFGVSAGATTTDFLYDGDALVAEYDGSGNLLRRYVHGPGIDEPLLWYEGSSLSTRRHLRSDHLGSAVAVTDASGNSFAINTYDEYGKRGPDNEGRFQYTGQILIPELGLYHYKARLYSAELGRFLQTDPIGYEDQMNLYAYVGNDPLSSSDPSGKEKVGLALSEKLVPLAGGKISIRATFDTETYEVSVEVSGSARAGLSSGHSFSAIKEPSSFEGNQASVEVSSDATLGLVTSSVSSEAVSTYDVRSGTLDVNAPTAPSLSLEVEKTDSSLTIGYNAGADIGVTASGKLVISPTEPLVKLEQAYFDWRSQPPPNLTNIP